MDDLAETCKNFLSFETAHIPSTNGLDLSFNVWRIVWCVAGERFVCL